jgi:hypothetical protein
MSNSTSVEVTATRGVNLVATSVSSRNGMIIKSVFLCKNYTDSLMNCDVSADRSDDNVYLYWEVNNGVGCCATYNCDYDAFYADCLDGGFKLYDIYLDDSLIPLPPDWSYTCEHRTPWNVMKIEHVKPGTHIIKIEQKDCKRVIDTYRFDFDFIQTTTGYTLLQRVS